jgi:hypothetical protein
LELLRENNEQGLDPAEMEFQRIQQQILRNKYDNNSNGSTTFDNTIVDDSNAEYCANASPEELYHHCLAQILISLALHPPKVISAAINFVNDFKHHKWKNIDTETSLLLKEKLTLTCFGSN